MVAIIEDKLQELKALCREYDVVKLELFGSATTEEFDETSSDLDFLVEFEYTESRSAFRQYFGFLHALEDLFGRDIDLVCPKTMSNPYFIESVNQSRQPIYDR